MLRIGKKVASFVVLIATAVLADGGMARADGHDDIDRLAVQVQQHVRVLYREVDTHAQGFPQQQAMLREVAALDRVATHVHDLAHRQGNSRHLRAEARKLDQMAHRLEDMVEGLARSGRANPAPLDHLRRALGRVDQAIHHLAEHVD